MFDFIPYLNSVAHESISRVGKDNYISTLKVKLVKNRDEHQDESIDVLTALREHAVGHVLLLGKPGSGKSTALKHLLQEEAKRCLLDSQRPVPVIIELRRLGGEDAFDSSKITIVKLIIEHAELACLTDQEVRQLLQQGKLLLLLDGINEIPPSNMLLTDFRKRFPNVPMIFTSRELGKGSYLGIDKQFQMLPLTEGQAKEFIEKKLVDHNSASQMWQALQGRIKELTDTPLLLDMLCSTYKNSKTIPQNRGKLFRQFTRDEYPKYKPSNSITLHSDDFSDFCNEVLQELAFFMMDAGGNEKHLWLQIERDIAKNNLQKYFSKEAGSKVNDWLRDALKFHLLQYTENENKIEFTHQLFQEYYAAEWLLHHLNNLSNEQLIAHFLNSHKWYESFKILADLLETEEQKNKLANAIHRLIQDLDYKDINYIYEWESLFSIFGNLHCDAAKNYVKKLIDGKPLLDKSSFENLDEFSKKTNIYKKQISNVIVLLWTWNDQSIIKVVILLSGLSLDIDIQTIFRMGILPTSDSRYIPILREMIENSRVNRLFRQTATIALGNFDKIESENILIRLLDSVDYDIRCLAAQSLGYIKSLKAKKALLNMIHADETLSDYHGNSYANGSYSPFRHHAYACEYATIALATIDIDTVIAELSIAIEQARDISKKNKYLNLLGKTESVKALPILLKQYQHDQETQLETVKSLGLIGSEDALPSILDFIEKSAFTAHANQQSELGTQESMEYLITINKIADAIKSLNNIIEKNLPSSKAILFLMKIIQTELYNKSYNIKHQILEILRRTPHYIALETWLSAFENDEKYQQDYFQYNSMSISSSQNMDSEHGTHKFLAADEIKRFQRAVKAIESFKVEIEPKYITKYRGQPSEKTKHYKEPHIYGYYSKEWFEKSNTIRKYPPIKEANMSGNTHHYHAPVYNQNDSINFNAETNNHGTIAKSITNHNHVMKNQAEFCPLILTEGKTDPIHLEYALKRLQKTAKFTNLKIEFASTKAEGKEGATETMRRCTDASIIFPNRTIIGLFDRDNKKSIPELKDKETHSLHALHPVYIAKIPQIEGLSDEIAIENYYSPTDLERTDTDGRKLKIEDGYKIKSPKTGENRQFLSKKDFAENVINEREGFKDIDVSNFAKIFELIEHIIEDAKKPK